MDNKKFEEVKNAIEMLRGEVCALSCKVAEQQVEINDLQMKEGVKNE